MSPCLDFVDPLLKLKVNRKIVQTKLPFPIQNVLHHRAVFSKIAVMARMNAKAAAVSGQLFHIRYSQSGSTKNLRNRQERQVREMFVINGVKLCVLDELHQMRELQRDRSSGFQHGFQSTRKVVDVGNMRKHIVANDQIRGPAGLGKPLSHGFAEEFSNHGDPDLLGGRRSARRRLDSETRNTGIHEIPKKISIIRGNLDDEAFAIQRKSSNDFLGISGSVPKPRR